MDFRDSPQEARFRAEVRDFLRRELPPEAADLQEWGTFALGDLHERVALERQWEKKLAVRGWIAPAWPEEYGGAGMTPTQQFILDEELALARAPRGNLAAVGILGPTLILCGTEEQKRQHLPPILSADVIWCQGFTEPGAGSDLGSVETASVREGDEYVINGRKIWTSAAQVADWMFLLARTNPNVPRDRSLGYFLLDMKSPGITIRPLTSMVNTQEFNEVLFDNVRIPKANLVGRENMGWYIALTSLDFERTNITSAAALQAIVEDLTRYVQQQEGKVGRLTDSVDTYRELADRAIECQVARLLSCRVASVQTKNQVANYEASITKLYVSELEQRVASTGMKLLGLYAQLGRESHWAPLSGRVQRLYLYSTTATIAAGTSEVQRIIIAVRGLRLPRTSN